MQLWVIQHIHICNLKIPHPQPHHWFIFFSSKILEVRKGFKCLPLEKKEKMRHPDTGGKWHCSY